MSVNKILMTGATGYIGGTILDHLIKSPEPSIQELTFDLFVRTEEQSQRLIQTYGSRVNPMLWKGLSDAAFIADTAANYDIVINTASGFIPTGARAFVDGLARRLGTDNPVPWMLHIAGCTNIADRPFTGEAHPEREWDDADGEAIYNYMKAEDEQAPYTQRTAEVGVLTASDETGVPAVSINIPAVFGEGTGLFNTQSIVVPGAIRYVVQHGYGYKLNETANFDWVHVEDVADLYVLLVRAILERDDRGIGYIPSGKKGIIFPAVGRALQVEISQRALDVAFAAGVLPRDDTPQEKEIHQITLQEVADEVAGGSLQIAEQGPGGHKAMKATMARRLGWNPTHLEEAWNKDFEDELVALNEGRRGVTIGNCIGGQEVLAGGK